jgi:hypothetical protein
MTADMAGPSKGLTVKDTPGHEADLRVLYFLDVTLTPRPQEKVLEFSRV